jgi:hypothetical protein
MDICNYTYMLILCLIELEFLILLILFQFFFATLLNKVNKKNTDGSLVIEIVPRDQDSKYVDLPDKGDKVEVWGAWVKDKPKGWNEIHPAWKVVIN